MNRRKVLGQLIRSMLIVMLLAFLFVLFRSLSGPSLTPNSTAIFDDVVIGQTAMRRYQGERVWATRLSEAQRLQARELDTLLVDASSGCVVEEAVCAVSSATARSGIELVFSEAAPAQLPSGAKWFGGFVDPTNGLVFDRLGRAYKGVKAGDEVTALRVVE